MSDSTADTESVADLQREIAGRTMEIPPFDELADVIGARAARVEV